MMRNYVNALIKLAVLNDEEFKNLENSIFLSYLDNYKIKDYFYLLDNVPDNIKNKLDKEMSLYDLFIKIYQSRFHEEHLVTNTNFADQKFQEQQKDPLRKFYNYVKQLKEVKNMDWLKMKFTQRDFDFLIDYRKKGLFPSNDKEKEDFSYNNDILEIIESNLLEYGDTVEDIIVFVIKKYNFFDEDAFTSFIPRFELLYKEYESDREIMTKPKFMIKFFENIINLIDQMRIRYEVFIKNKEDFLSNFEIVKALRKSDIFDLFYDEYVIPELQKKQKKDKPNLSSSTSEEKPNISSINQQPQKNESADDIKKLNKKIYNDLVIVAKILDNI